MQADQKPVIWTVVAASVILALILIVGTVSVGNKIGNGLNVMNTKLEGLDIDEQAIADAIVKGMPEWEVPDINTISSDRLCEMTPGCKFWEADNPTHWEILVLAETEEFNETFSGLVNIDEDYLEYIYEIKESQVRAYGEEHEGIDSDWETKIFLRVRYWDTDEGSSTDYEVVYVLVTSEFDEGEYDSMTVEEVSRNFEFN